MLLRKSNLNITNILLKSKSKNANKSSYIHLSQLSLSTITDKKTKKEPVETKEERRKIDIRILRELGKHLWPDKNHPNSFNLKTRVVTAVSLLIASKIINIQVPFLFKALVDSFEVDHTTLNNSITNSIGESIGQPLHPLILATPIAIVMGYGIARASSSLAAELRSAVFAPVAHDAIRQGDHVVLVVVLAVVIE